MAHVTDKRTQPEGLDTWVLAGQSNMAGCGDVRESLPPDPRVWCFYSDGRWDIARDPLHDSVNSFAPVDMAMRRNGAPPEMRQASDEALRKYWIDRDSDIGAGPGMSFGSALADATGRPVGLIAAAHGGTSLEQWSQDKKAMGLHSLYGAMLERIRRAGGNLKGILWYQGESDTSPLSAAQSYPQRFTDWIAAARADTGRPDLPVLIVQIGRCLNAYNEEFNRGWNLVQYALADIPLRVARTAVTSAIDLGMNDKIHLNAHGQIRLGRRLARLALRMTEGRKDIPAGPRLERIELLPVMNRGRGKARLHFSGVTGGWRPAHDMSGFLVKGADGLPIQSKGVYSVYRDPQQEDAILVCSEGPMVPGDTLVYGYGRAPVCHVADEADMPLCAFACAVR